MSNHDPDWFTRESIRELAGNDNVIWFVDANVIISGDAEDLFSDRTNAVTTRNVVEEIRKRPECKSANQFIDGIVSSNSVVTEDSFSSSIASVEFLINCAKHLAPAVRVLKQALVNEEGLTPNEAEVRAIETVAKRGAIFECDLFKFAVKEHILAQSDSAIDKPSRRSWFRYPNKKRKQEHSGEYRFSDETMVAFTVANSILKNQKTCLLSNDTDCSAIMKQLADNLLWTASAMDCELTYKRLDLDLVIRLSESRCQDLDRYRQQQSARRMVRMLRADYDSPGQIFEPYENEVIICRPNDCQISTFGFSDAIANFVREYGYLKRRCQLIQKGSWIP